MLASLKSPLKKEVNDTLIIYKRSIHHEETHLNTSMELKVGERMTMELESK